MSASSDRTTYLKYCVSGPKTCVCCPKTVVADISGQVVGIDPSSNTVALDLTTGLGDAFSRLRVSNPYTLFEFNSITGKNPLYIDEATTGAATSTWIDDSYISMTVSNTGDAVIRQSHDYVLYQPGKSKLIFMTGVLYTDPSPSADNIIARIGAFDAEMGVFVQKDASGMSVVLRNDGSDDYVLQTNWSLNQLPTVEFTKAQIFVFDFEWLGVGQLRCGLVINGEIVYYHVFEHMNGLTAPYIPMAKLPLRYEIRSTGSANEMRMICGTVISEGGLTPFGKEFTRGLYTYSQRVSISSTAGSNPFVPLMALRLRSTDRFPRTTIKIKGIDVFSVDANKYGSWQLLLVPQANITAASWANVDTTNESAAQVAFNDTAGTALTITAGTGFPLYTNYYTTRTNSIIETTTDAIVAAYPITTGLSGVSDVVVLVANHIASGSSSVDLFAAIRWLELI